MARNPDHTWPVPSWAQARDCEALYGRAVAEATWGIGYYRDEPSSLKGEDHERRIADLERAANQLFALAAMRQAQKQEAKASPIQRGGKKPWKPADGLASREV